MPDPRFSAEDFDPYEAEVPTDVAAQPYPQFDLTPYPMIRPEAIPFVPTDVPAEPVDRAAQLRAQLAQVQGQDQFARLLAGVTLPQSMQGTNIGDNVNAPVAGYSERFGSPAPVIKAAVAQLNAGQPVTALPRVSFSYDQQQAYIARLNEFDRQAKAARMAADQAARDAQLLDQMSRVAKSTKDIEVQRHMIDAMAGQRELAAGVPLYQVAARHPLMFGGGLSAALNTAPKAPAKWVGAAGGAPGHFELGSGGVVVPPESAMQSEPLNEQMTVANDPDTGKRLGLWARTSRGARRFIPDPVEKDVTPHDRIIAYNAQERAILRELEAPGMMGAARNPASQQRAEYDDLRRQLEAIRNERSALMGTGRPVVMPRGTNAVSRGPTGPIRELPISKSELVKDGFYNIKGAVYGWNGTNFVKVATK